MEISLSLSVTSSSLLKSWQLSVFIFLGHACKLEINILDKKKTAWKRIDQHLFISQHALSICYAAEKMYLKVHENRAS